MSTFEPTHRFASRADLVRRLGDSTPIDASQWSPASLPRPVQRYLARVLPDDWRGAAGVRLLHAGEFDMSASGTRWRPFESRQWIAAARPGFVWSARIAAWPGLPVRVVDSYVGGVGALSASLWGVVPLVRAGGTPALARGELMRWLAEAVYVPWALAVCPGLAWHECDDHHADAHLSDGETTVALRFAFGADDLVTTVSAEARPRMLGRAVVETPWEGHWSDYRRFGGVLVPTRGDVQWRIDGQARPYWRASVVELERVAATASEAQS